MNKNSKQTCQMNFKKSIGHEPTRRKSKHITADFEARTCQSDGRRAGKVISERKLISGRVHALFI